MTTLRQIIALEVRRQRGARWCVFRHVDCLLEPLDRCVRPQDFDAGRGQCSGETEQEDPFAMRLSRFSFLLIRRRI